MHDVQIIADPAAATVALDPIRARLLAELSAPASAAALAERIGLPRQKINYHLKTLEAHGLVAPAETRQWGGLTERLMVATASSYVVSPEALGQVAADPARMSDRLSAGYLIALGARLVREVGAMLVKARATNKRLATLSIDTEVALASPAARAEFTTELTETIARLVAKYHQPDAEGARPHRLIVAAHPWGGKQPDGETEQPNSSLH